MIYFPFNHYFVVWGSSFPLLQELLWISNAVFDAACKFIVFMWLKSGDTYRKMNKKISIFFCLKMVFGLLRSTPKLHPILRDKLSPYLFAGPRIPF